MVPSFRPLKAYFRELEMISLMMSPSGIRVSTLRVGMLIRTSRCSFVSMV
jgi:hypothetical protein